MPRKQPMQIGTCPDCDSENVKLTLRGVCRKCYLRQNNCARDGKEYIPYNQSPNKKRREDISTSIIKSKTPTKRGRKPKQKTAEIKADEKFSAILEVSREEELELQKKDLSKLDPSEYIMQDLRTRCSKLNTPVDIDKFKDDIIDVRKLTDTLYKLTTVTFNDQISELDSLLNELERLYQHQWEASGFAIDDREKFEALIVIRRDLKEYISGVRALLSAISPNRAAAYDMIKTMKMQVDGFYKRYQNKEYHAEAPAFLNKESVSGQVKQSQLKLYDVDILTDVRNDRHFTQSRWATSPEGAIQLVKDFLKVKRIPVQFKDSDIKVVESSQVIKENQND